jgi:hypothetical protein
MGAVLSPGDAKRGKRNGASGAEQSRKSFSVERSPRKSTTEVCIRVAGEAPGGALQNGADRETDANVREPVSENGNPRRGQANCNASNR